MMCIIFDMAYNQATAPNGAQAGELSLDYQSMSYLMLVGRLQLNHINKVEYFLLTN